MKTFSKFLAICRQTLPVALMASAMLASTTASAAVYTWGGSNANWGTNGSWLNNAQPVNGSSVLFTNAGTGTASTVNISRQIADITFGASVNRSYTLLQNAANVTTLGSLINSSSYRQNVGNNLSLSSTNGVINTGAAGILLGSKLTGTGTYSKTGSGQLEITNYNNSGFTGSLSVDAGSVKLTAGLDSANVIVNSGATVYGDTGLLGGNAGYLDVKSGGTLSPGDGGTTYGLVSVTHDATLNAGSATVMGVGSISDFDQVTSGGTTTFGGALTINMNYTPDHFAALSVPGDSWALFSVGPSGSFAGDFTSITLGGTAYGPVTFYKVTADYWEANVGGGKYFNFFVNDAIGGSAGTLYAVPEPSTIVFAGIGLAMCGWSTWTRRRAKARRQAIEASIA